MDEIVEDLVCWQAIVVIVEEVEETKIGHDVATDVIAVELEIELDDTIEQDDEDTTLDVITGQAAALVADVVVLEVITEVEFVEIKLVVVLEDITLEVAIGQAAYDALELVIGQAGMLVDEIEVVDDALELTTGQAGILVDEIEVVDNTAELAIGQAGIAEDVLIDTLEFNGEQAKIILEVILDEFIKLEAFVIMELVATVEELEINELV